MSADRPCQHDIITTVLLCWRVGDTVTKHHRCALQIKMRAEFMNGRGLNHEYWVPTQVLSCLLACHLLISLNCSDLHERCQKVWLLDCFEIWHFTHNMTLNPPRMFIFLWVSFQQLFRISGCRNKYKKIKWKHWPQNIKVQRQIIFINQSPMKCFYFAKSKKELRRNNNNRTHIVPFNGPKDTAQEGKNKYIAQRIENNCGKDCQEGTIK